MKICKRFIEQSQPPKLLEKENENTNDSDTYTGGGECLR